MDFRPLVIERSFGMTTNSTAAEDRLAKLGIHLPDAPTEETDESGTSSTIRSTERNHK